jgi:uncharacterized protein (TIGR02145 family)
MKILSWIFLILLLISCNSRKENKELDSDMSRIEGREEMIKSEAELALGNQVWMKNNLNVSTFRNGDIILEAQTEEEWQKAWQNGKPAWCYYVNNPNAAEKNSYGKLYNWHAVKDPRGLAPDGWRIPTKEDWEQLINFLGGNNMAGNKMKTVSGWKKNDIKTSFFFALPTGGRSDNGKFDGLNESAWFWSDYYEVGIGPSFLDLSSWDHAGLVKGSNSSEGYGLSVRCIKELPH